MPSLKDIAQRANTSITTVSLVLNGRDGSVRISPATREQVLAAARDLGYTPNVTARRLRSSRTEAPTLTIGALMPLDERLTISIRSAGAIRQALDTWAQSTGATSPDLLIETYQGGTLANVRSLADHNRYNGTILFSTLPADDHFLAKTVPLPLPVVLVQRSIAGHSWVNSDNRRMGGEVAAHLVGLGHRRFAVVTSSIMGGAQAERLEGFTAVLKRNAGIEVSPHHVARQAFSETGGYEATRQLLHQLSVSGEAAPTALFVTADLMAVGALHALKEAGLRIPEDIAVVGYDNDPAAMFTDPPLTTVDALIPQGARKATTMLLDLIHDREAAPRTHLLDARLIVRASCGASRADHAGGNRESVVSSS